MRIALASVITLMFFGWVLKLHGDQEGSKLQEHIGLSMMLAATFTCVLGGFVVLWTWAI